MGEQRHCSKSLLDSGHDGTTLRLQVQGLQSKESNTAKVTPTFNPADSATFIPSGCDEGTTCTGASPFQRSRGLAPSCAPSEKALSGVSGSMKYGRGRTERGGGVKEGVRKQIKL